MKETQAFILLVYFFALTLFLLSVCCVLSRSVMSNSLQLHGLQPVKLLSMAILQARTLEWVPCPPPRDLPNSGTEPRSPALQADSLLTEPPGKTHLYYTGL